MDHCRWLCGRDCLPIRTGSKNRAIPPLESTSPLSLRIRSPSCCPHTLRTFTSGCTPSNFNSRTGLQPRLYIPMPWDDVAENLRTESLHLTTKHWEATSPILPSLNQSLSWKENLKGSLSVTIPKRFPLQPLTRMIHLEVLIARSSNDVVPLPFFLDVFQIYSLETTRY